MVTGDMLWLIFMHGRNHSLIFSTNMKSGIIHKTVSWQLVVWDSNMNISVSKTNSWPVPQKNVFDYIPTIMIYEASAWSS